jgi:hypothetical protein
METGFSANRTGSTRKVQDEDSAYYPLSEHNNMSMYALSQTNSNRSQQSFHPQQDGQPPPYASPSRTNLHPNNPYLSSQPWDNESSYSLQGGAPPSPTALHPPSPYAMNPHAAGSVGSVHLERQQHEHGAGAGRYGGNEYAGSYAR